MGKVTGFLEYERLEEGYEPVPQRVRNWKEDRASKHPRTGLK